MGEVFRLWAQASIACCAGCNRSGVMGLVKTSEIERER